MQENHSDIARLLQRIADEYSAATSGLTGLASGAATHQFITARMERMHTCQSALKDLVGEQEASKMMNETLADL